MLLLSALVVPPAWVVVSPPVVLVLEVGVGVAVVAVLVGVAGVPACHVGVAFFTTAMDGAEEGAWPPAPVTLGAGAESGLLRPPVKHVLVQFPVEFCFELCFVVVVAHDARVTPSPP